jgi:ABC-2 type transport system ATP-binding protein
LIRVALRNGNAANSLEFPADVEVVEQENGQLTLRAPRADTAAITAHLLNTLSVADLTVEDPPIEAVIDQIYQEETV